MKILLLIAVPAVLFAQDADRDGLDDVFEQELLDRFAPTFLVSGNDCDSLPATFAPGESAPRPLARDGRIYGQVFPVGADIEIHYYHLWSRDCGRVGHAFDPEHVSVLLRGPEWRAVYWYAAAHENTWCNASQGAPAARLGAEERGVTVWVSAGKHASFLSVEACRGGCGADRCEAMTPLPRSQVVNLGERSAPLNGATWTASAAWPLEAKMGTDFSRTVLDQLEHATGVTSLNRPPGALQSAVAFSSNPAGAVRLGRDETEAALTAGQSKMDRGIRDARRAVRGWLRKVLR